MKFPFLLLLALAHQIFMVAVVGQQTHHHGKHGMHKRKSILHSLLDSGRIYNGSTPISSGTGLNYIELPGETPLEKCVMKDMDNFNHMVPYKQCIRDHSLNELVSNMIWDTGAYGHGQKEGCNSLLYLWTISSLSTGVGDTITNNDNEGIFLDVGGNIGTCSLLLASIGAEVIAFEPMPPNYKVFVQSILANPTFKIKLYPYGAGDYDAKAAGFTQDNNMGNGVIGMHIPITRKDHIFKNDVQVKTLDQILWPSVSLPVEQRQAPPVIRVMKVDVQGYEYRAITGAKALFECGAIKTIQWEQEIHFLGKQGANPMMICKFLMDLNYRVSSMDGVWYKNPDDCHQKNAGGMNDMQARLIKPVNTTCWGTGTA